LQGSKNQHPEDLQNCLGIIHIFGKGKDQKTFSHFNCLHEQLDVESTATRCQWATGWASLD